MDLYIAAQGNPGARTAMQYAIDLVNVPSILQAHIHQGPQGSALCSMVYVLYVQGLAVGKQLLCCLRSVGQPEQILRAPAGMNGPICVFLYGPVTNPSPTPFTGHFGQGVITEARHASRVIRC